jgi:AraC family transcriptional regulator
MMRARPVTYSSPDRLEISCHHSPPVVYAEEAHETVQVCVPLERALYGVTRQSETGRTITQSLGARDVLVVPAGQPHAVTWRRPADIVSLHFSHAFLAEALDSPAVVLADTFTVRDPFISAAAAQLRALGPGARLSPAFAEAVATTIAYRVVAAADRRTATTGTVRALSGAQLARIDRYVEAHLDRPIPLSPLAAELGLSVWHFMRRFQASHGVSPHDYITQRRLARARALLLTSTLPVAAVALEVGLSHSHFSRTFLRRCGVSPLEYRRQFSHSQPSI